MFTGITPIRWFARFLKLDFVKITLYFHLCLHGVCLMSSFGMVMLTNITLVRI